MLTEKPLECEIFLHVKVCSFKFLAPEEKDGKIKRREREVYNNIINIKALDKTKTGNKLFWK